MSFLQPAAAFSAIIIACARMYPSYPVVEISAPSTAATALTTSTTRIK